LTFLQKLEKAEYFDYLDSQITNDARGTREIKFRIPVTKAAFSLKKTLLTSKLNLIFRKKLVKCYIWSIKFYGAETWTLRKADQICVESFEMWCWRRMETITWTDRVKNEECYVRVKVEKHTYIQ
jgi:hypothetical protein